MLDQAAGSPGSIPSPSIPYYKGDQFGVQHFRPQYCQAIKQQIGVFIDHGISGSTILAGNNNLGGLLEHRLESGTPIGPWDDGRRCS